MNFELWFAGLKQFSFAYRDMIGQDRWESWSPTYSFVTATDLTVTGRMRIVGKKCEFQVSTSGTSIETTGGTSYIALPMTMAGIAGMAVMYNSTTSIAVGVCAFDVANSRLYVPTQAASANSFAIAGWFEV